MSRKYNYYVEQEKYIREPQVRVYAYQSSPSWERRPDDFQRYPSMHKLFNNRASFGEPGLGVFNLSQQTPMKHGPHPQQKVRFVEPREDIGRKKEAEDEGIDAAADGFISWKRKSLQMCKTFAD